MKIRSDILRTYQSIHTWTGITAGLLLFIGFFAGSITMFRVAIDDWATPKQYTQAQIPFAELEAAVPKYLPSTLHHKKSCSFSSAKQAPR